METVANTFCIAKEEQKELLIIDNLSKGNAYPIDDINTKTPPVVLNT